MHARLKHRKSSYQRVITLYTYCFAVPILDWPTDHLKMAAKRMRTTPSTQGEGEDDGEGGPCVQTKASPSTKTLKIEL